MQLQKISSGHSIVCHFFMNDMGEKGQKQQPGVFYKKSVLKNFATFTGKHFCRSLIFKERKVIEKKSDRKYDMREGE